MKDTSAELPNNAKARYTALQGPRQTALQRARDNSKLTIPGLVPEDGQDANASFSQPWQSLGARGLNNLASWLLVTLLPPDNPMFRMAIHEDTAESLGTELSTVQEGLSRISKKVQLKIETSAARPVFMETLRHLIAAGNALLYQPIEGGTPRMFRLDQFVVLRDEKGQMIEAVVKERVYPSALEEAVRAAVNVNVEKGKDTTDLVDVYTHIRKVGDECIHYQQINDILVPGSEGRSPYDSRGWIALRWQAIPGSDYGRAMVSEYYGDLISLEDISKAIIQFAAAASRVVNFVHPSSMVDIEELAEAESGEFISGDGDHVKAHQLDKGQDFAVANTVAERLELRLSHAFMLRSGTTRDAERVTAEEIRVAAQELENVLGGTYTVLSSELQLPYVKRLLYILQKDGEAPELPDSVNPTIVTGFEAMGRTHSANRLRAFVADFTDSVGQERASAILNTDEIAKRFAESYSLEDTGTLLKSPEQQAEEQQAKQAQAAVQAAAPQIAKASGDALNQSEGNINGEQ